MVRERLRKYEVSFGSDRATLSPCLHLNITPVQQGESSFLHGVHWHPLMSISSRFGPAGAPASSRSWAFGQRPCCETHGSSLDVSDASRSLSMSLFSHPMMPFGTCQCSSTIVGLWPATVL